MWEAMRASADNAEDEPPPAVAWDALWADAPSPHHHHVHMWGLDDLDAYLAHQQRIAQHRRG
jgi:hypothetical protein